MLCNAVRPGWSHCWLTLFFSTRPAATAPAPASSSAALYRPVPSHKEERKRRGRPKVRILSSFQEILWWIERLQTIPELPVQVLDRDPAVSNNGLSLGVHNSP